MIVGEVISYPQKNKAGARNANGKSDNIQQTESFIAN
jgi:hypothetical protein